MSTFINLTQVGQIVTRRAQARRPARTALNFYETDLYLRVEDIIGIFPILTKFDAITGNDGAREFTYHEILMTSGRRYVISGTTYSKLTAISEQQLRVNAFAQLTLLREEEKDGRFILVPVHADERFSYGSAVPLANILQLNKYSGRVQDLRGPHWTIRLVDGSTYIITDGDFPGIDIVNRSR